MLISDRKVHIYYIFHQLLINICCHTQILNLLLITLFLLFLNLLLITLFLLFVTSVAGLGRRSCQGVRSAWVSAAVRRLWVEDYGGGGSRTTAAAGRGLRQRRVEDYGSGGSAARGHGL
ncbi:hypothetical protein BDZ91DRAFT_477307 [Kalaharituber pfeilii]|nr:hypothetical protein BDZ91DRAFT_477307 [Kalaharituber pfeilii]